MATYKVTTTTQVSTIVVAPEPAKAIGEAGHRFKDLGVRCDPTNFSIVQVSPIWRVHDSDQTLFFYSCKDRIDAVEAYASTIHKPDSVGWQDLVAYCYVEQALQSEIWAALEDGRIAA